MLASIVLTTAILGHAVLGSPVTLVKRANNGAYLANCVTRAGTADKHAYSEFAYYNNARSGSQSGQWPDEIAYPSLSGNVPNIVTWEGQQRCATFGSATTLCSQISGSAQSLSTGQYAGSGSNSYGATFSCYKDNNRILYNVPEGSQRQHTCRSIYYCFQN